MKMIFGILLIILFINFSSAAHFIVGIAEDAKDGSSANGKTVVLWNPLNGISDNETDIVGSTGNSGVDNIYMLDCELLSNRCNIGDVLSLKIFDSGDGYFSYIKNVTVTGAGFDLVENLTLLSPPNFISIEVDDELSVPQNEINLLPATTKNITCRAIIREYDGENRLFNVTSEFFGSISSNYGALSDNNFHYKNESCYLNYSYGSNEEIEVLCGFEIWYYANPENWNCTMNATDNASISRQDSDTTQINELLALGVTSPVDFGEVGAQKVSNEITMNVTNYGNVMINLSLSGYGLVENDGNAMSCENGNISIEYIKFNLTHSNSTNMTLQEFETNYQNLSSSSIIKQFDLDYRQNDLINNVVNDTYWRVYIPKAVAGNCQGNIIFGAVQANEI